MGGIRAKPFQFKKFIHAVKHESQRTQHVCHPHLDLRGTEIDGMPEWHQVKQCRGSPQARPANLQQKRKIALPRPGTYLTRKRSRRLCHSFQYRTEALSSGNSKPPEVPNSLFRCPVSRLTRSYHRFHEIVSILNATAEISCRKR